MADSQNTPAEARIGGRGQILELTTTISGTRIAVTRHMAVIYIGDDHLIQRMK